MVTVGDAALEAWERASLVGGRLATDESAHTPEVPRSIQGDRIGDPRETSSKHTHPIIADLRVPNRWFLPSLIRFEADSHLIHT